MWPNLLGYSSTTYYIAGFFVVGESISDYVVICCTNDGKCNPILSPTRALIQSLAATVFMRDSGIRTSATARVGRRAPAAWFSRADGLTIASIDVKIMKAESLSPV